MKATLVMKVIILIAQITAFVVPVMDAMASNNNNWNPILYSYPWLGVIQPISCLFNVLFLRRVCRSPLRIVYELLLSGFFILALCGGIDWNFRTSIMVWFCGGMALGYGLISFHEILMLKAMLKEEDERARTRSEW